jgi:hypothetical protein
MNSPKIQGYREGLLAFTNMPVALSTLWLSSSISEIKRQMSSGPARAPTRDVPTPFRDVQFSRCNVPIALRKVPTELRRVPASGMDVPMSHMNVPKLRRKVHVDRRKVHAVCMKVHAEYMNPPSPAGPVNIGLDRPSQNTAGVFLRSI